MLALIDGDVLCYNACPSRYQKDAQGNWIVQDAYSELPEWTPEEERAYIEKAWFKLQELIQNVCEKVYATDYLMAVKGEGNFRNDMYPEYKLNRHKNVKVANHIVPLLRKLAVNSGLAVPADGREADDLLRIWAEECKRSETPYIVCSIDKDLKCIPGPHYFIHKDSIEQISDAAAIRFYYEQLLKGDPTDNIPGVPKIGEVKASKTLAPYTTEEEFQEAVVELYLSAYDTEWYDYLLSNGKMLYLQKTPNDYFRCFDWPVVSAILEMQKEERQEKNDRSEEVGDTN